jgi:hypothetical protein
METSIRIDEGVEPATELKYDPFVSGNQRNISSNAESHAGPSKDSTPLRYW